MSTDKLPEEGKYWYTDTEFPGIKVRMDGVREFIIDANLGLSDESIEILMKGIGYWFLKRSSIMFPPKPSVSYAAEQIITELTTKSIVEPIINTYNAAYNQAISDAIAAVDSCDTNEPGEGYIFGQIDSKLKELLKPSQPQT